MPAKATCFGSAFGLPDFDGPVLAGGREMLAVRRKSRQIGRMFGLTRGELALVTFIVVAILSARYWPRVGEWVAKRFERS